MNPVKIEIQGDVMTVTLADVENRNALGGALVGGLRDALAQANADPAVRAIVMTNEGSTFCAGANLKERSGAKSQTKNSGGFDDLLHLFHRVDHGLGHHHVLSGVQSGEYHPSVDRTGRVDTDDIDVVSLDERLVVGGGPGDSILRCGL